MQPPPPAGFRSAPAGPAAEAAGRAGERAEPLRSRVPLGARGSDRGGQDLQGRGPPLFGERLLHGVGGGPEALLHGRSGTLGQPGFPRAPCVRAAKRCARPHEGSRGARLRPLPRGGRAGPSHGHGRGDAHRPGQSRQGLSRPVYPRRARGPGIPEGPLPHRQGTAPEAAGPPRARFPRRRLGEIPRALPAAGRAESGRGQAPHRVRPPRPARRR